MGDTLFLDRMLLQLCLSCKYYSGYPKDPGPSWVIHFREFVQLLHQGYHVVVAFTIRFNEKLNPQRAFLLLYSNLHALTVVCLYPGFCITRQKSDYPFIEIFHSPQQAGNEGKVQDPNITWYSVKVVPPLWVREFFKRQGVRTSYA
ncbi:hypothetical protein Bca52824_022328 [Brassica carinata]|uniref:Uncharacterized protein n=1 Tax=Brassica carinata TaxID=52824 RepID=A0A8X7VGD3_BRACI|nr:hypothetical protein Bca52824_022328 [Brassica carinata]